MGLEGLREAVEKVAGNHPERLVLSAPRAEGKYRRAVVAPLGAGWQIERFTETQAFHQNIEEPELAKALLAMLEEEFTQLTAFAGGREHRLRVSKKGKVLLGSSGATAKRDGAPPAPARHDREKSRFLPEGTLVPPLVDMGVMGKDGRIIASMQGKYRQIDRFIELIDHALKGQAPRAMRVIDFG